MSVNGRERLNYGLLRHTPENWASLRKFFEDVPSFVPDAELGVASVTTTERGEIVGGLVLQMVSYMGPFKVEPAYAGVVDYVKLKNIIDEQFQRKEGRGHLIINGYVVLTADKTIARMAEMAGMTRKPEGIILVQEFGGEHSIVR